MAELTRTQPPDPNDGTVTRTDGNRRDSAPGDFLSPPGYELREEIGRGGMGVVYRARDQDLAREVAVKILLPHYSPQSATARRFLDEARITGRLQHPGIPAIYRVGTLEDGRPFLAMKLIGGRTLEEMLKERDKPAGASSSVSNFEKAAQGMFDRLDTILDRWRYLAIFEQIAQAVGYAHQQGVIHRDLKPANVMVGAFGEVQVMDWGIARSGDRKAETTADGSPAATVEYAPHLDAHTPESDLTQAGAVLGTPAYMPPEQAIGAVDKIGKPSDVFGLGAILCAMLTGKPPYDATDAESNRQLAARAKLDDAFARLDSCGAEPELVALAKRCLAPEPADRPADAGVVAKAVADLRADAELRARQAEMDRARAEVKATEEQKHRRVQRALAFTVLGLMLVAAYTARRIDNEVSHRRADHEAHLRRDEADKEKRRVDLQTRQLTTERDVLAALNEVQVLREEGIKQADDPARWALTLIAAESAFKRAEGILAAGEPSDDIVLKIATAHQNLEADRRDRALLAELDQISDRNEISLFLPLPNSRVILGQYASAFRKHGIDLLTAPSTEAIAWLKGHRHRGRLTTAIRSWHLAYPAWELATAVDIPFVEAVVASAAVSGLPLVAALAQDPEKTIQKLSQQRSPHARLKAILDAATEDPFVREWWSAIARRDSAVLKTLVQRPEFTRLTSREMSSLADGISPYSPFPDSHQVLDSFLERARDRFPGEFWVHFRSAFQNLSGGASQIDDSLPDLDERAKHEAAYRHLTAAIAIRPQSALARTAMGIEMMDVAKDRAQGLRLLRSAVELDPHSPWPHLILGMTAFEEKNWPEAIRELKASVRADPDTAFFMVSVSRMLSDDADQLSDAEVAGVLRELIEIHPQHPGGYELLGKYYYQLGDHRAALEQFQKARERSTADHPWNSLATIPIELLEQEARWEQKLPLVLRGELRPASAEEYTELVSYCAAFDKKYALAIRFLQEGIKNYPDLLTNWMRTPKFAGWAIQAAAGHGVDADTTPLAVREQYRRLALEWIRNLLKNAGMGETIVQFELLSNRDFLPVRAPKELAKLPLAERTEWEKLWAEIAPVAVAPRPRPARLP